MEVRLPRVRFEYEDEEGFSSGNLSWGLLAGFGAHWAWVFCCAGAALSAGAAYWMWALAAFAFSLLCYGFLSDDIRALFGTARQRVRNRWVGAALTACGTAVTAACLVVPLPAACGALAGCAQGIGSCILLVSFGVSFSQCDVAATVMTTALSLLVGMAWCALGYALRLPLWVAMLACAALPVAEAVCLKQDGRESVDKLEFSRITLRVHKGPIGLRLMVPGFFMGLACTALGIDAARGLTALDRAESGVMVMAAAAVCLCVLLLFVLMLLQEQEGFLLRLSGPFAVLAVAWCVYYTTSPTEVTLAVVLMVYLLFEAVTWSTYADLAQRHRLPAFVVFGFGRGGMALGTFTVFYVRCLGVGQDWSLAEVGFGFTVVACVLLALSFHSHEQNFTRLVIDEIKVAAEEPHTAHAKEDATLDGLSSENERCLRAADLFLLSKRETEVLLLLMQGDKSGVIQRKLYISEGTARTHMNHIYKKMNVHSQSELIDLVRSL